MGQYGDYPIGHHLCERRVVGFRIRAYEGKNDQTYWFAYGLRRQRQGAFEERAQCRGRQLTITPPILAAEVAEVAKTVHTGSRRYVSFGAIVAQGATCCLQPQMAVERDGRLSGKALELPAQRALGRTSNGGDFASSERAGESTLHKLNRHRNASRGRTAAHYRQISVSVRLLHPIFPRCQPSAPRIISCFGSPSNIAAGLDPELVGAAHC